MKSSSAEIKNIKRSIMRTIEFDMKCVGHRGFQNFLCYPISNPNDDKVKIQSKKRIGLYSPKHSAIMLSKSRSGGSYFHHLQFDPLVRVELTPEQNKALRDAIHATAGFVSNGIISSDNMGAIMLPKTNNP